MTSPPTSNGAIDPRVDVGQVHLMVADLNRALAVSCGLLGFELQQRMDVVELYLDRPRAECPKRPPGKSTGSAAASISPPCWLKSEMASKTSHVDFYIFRLVADPK